MNIKYALRALPLVVCLAVTSRPTSYAQVGLPAGWQSIDIGAVGQPGSSSMSGDTFVVSGAGADIWGTTDAFHYTYRTLTGDGTISARVAAVSAGNAWIKVGVMIRATTHASAAHGLMLVSAGKGLSFQRRTTSGVTMTSTTVAGAAPKWVRLTRTGNTVAASFSSDGMTWTLAGSDTISLPSTALVGLAVSSHDPTQLATGTFDSVSITAPVAPTPPPAATGRLQIVPGSHFLRHPDNGQHFLYLAEAAWSIFRRLNRTDADFYLKDAAAKGFTGVQVSALWQIGYSNAYGDRPLGRTDGSWDPAKILTTPGNNPASATEYDYWDHVDYVLDRAQAYGLYVTVEPTWGTYVSGTTSYAVDMSSNIFTVANARTYGEFLGRRYGARTNIIWMLGGDRAPVYPNGDFRPVWRSMAEGIARGATGLALTWDQPHSGWNSVMMTYHGNRRDPASSAWFHDDPWLDFNGVHAEYSNIVSKATADWNKLPVKPLLVFEARYENEYSANRILFTGAFKQRYQAYHALLAGSFGYAYGHKNIWPFTTDEPWQDALNAPGRLAMAAVRRLLGSLTNSELLGRMPDQSLLDGPLGSAVDEDLLIAMRGSDRRFAVVYSTNGRDIPVKMSQLATGTADAYWFSPRTGRYCNSSGTHIGGPFAQYATGSGVAIRTFNPPRTPAAENDWVLLLRVR